MAENIQFVGLDVHADTIAVAVTEASGEVRPVGIIPNRPEAIRKLVRKLGPARSLLPAGVSCTVTGTSRLTNPKEIGRARLTLRIESGSRRSLRQ